MFKEKNPPSDLECLMHRVFSQSEDGAKLLAYWNETIIHSIVIETDAGKLAYQAGAESWIKNINAAIRKVEDS